MDQHQNDDDFLFQENGTPQPANGDAAPASQGPDDFLGLGVSLAGAASGEAQAGGDAWLHEELAAEGEDEGSWLMSLDDVLGDRAGLDPILEDEDVLAEDPSLLDASWHERPGHSQTLRRLWVPLAAASVLALVGAAGWRLVELDGRLSPSAPEALTPELNLGSGRILKPETSGETGPERIREVIGFADESRRPNSPFARPDGELEDGLIPPADGSAPEFPELAAGPSTEPALGPPVLDPHALLEPGAPLVAEATPLVAEATPPPSATSGPLAPGVPAPEVQARWRGLFRLGSSAPPSSAVARGETDPGALRAPSEGRAAPSAPGSLELPYGLSAAFIPDWVPGVMPLREDYFDEPQPTGFVGAASWSDMTAVWQGSEVPLAAMEREGRLLTPAVGFVGVTLESGEIIDGRLESVGAGRLWLATPYGRTGIEAQRIREVVPIHAMEAASGVAVVEDLARVRVHTQSGVLVGRVLVSGHSVTVIVTEGGTRITVPTSDVEFVGAAADVVLKRG